MSEPVITIRCPHCASTFTPTKFGQGLHCSSCQGIIPPTQLLSQLLDHWWEPRRWRADLHRPSVNFLLEKLWTANGQGEALYAGIGPKYANYSIFRYMVTQAIVRGLDQGWMELEFPADPMADDPIYKLTFSDSDRFGSEMEKLFPEVNWDEPIDVPTSALPAKPAPPRPSKRRSKR